MLFKLYLYALIELAAFNPELLSVDYQKNWMYYPKVYNYDLGAKYCAKNKDLWLTKVYSWNEVNDADLCALDLVEPSYFVTYK